MIENGSFHIGVVHQSQYQRKSMIGTTAEVRRRNLSYDSDEVILTATGRHRFKAYKKWKEQGISKSFTNIAFFVCFKCTGHYLSLLLSSSLSLLLMLLFRSHVQ